MAKPRGAGDRFHLSTRLTRHRESKEQGLPPRRPVLYKKYRNAKLVPLPEPAERGGPRLWDAIRSRRSVRDYGPGPLTTRELSHLLWASGGVTAGKARDALRAAPSAGALYPVETYVAVSSVRGIEAGLYHYGVDGHRLHLIKAGEFGEHIEDAALGQECVGAAAVVFAWSAVFDRCKFEYGQRAYRYLYLDAGHVAQNLALAAVALGLGSCPIGAFYDEEMDRLFGLDGEREAMIYLTAVGRSA